MHPTARRPRPAAHALVRLHHRLGLALLVGVVLLLATLRPAPVHAATITVNTTANDNPPAPNCTLGQAVQAAISQQVVAGCAAGTGNDTITFATGLMGTISVTSPFVITMSNSISLTIDGPGSSSLTIDGGGQSYLFALNGPINFTVAGVTLQNGHASHIDEGGGAIYNNGGTVSISNSTFNGNSADVGGAIYSTGDDSSVTITNSTFTNNQACCFDGSSGGAIYTDDGSLIITGSTFTNNQAPRSGILNNDGGAIYSDGTTFSINNSFFSNNTAQDNGGAIYHYNATFYLSGSNFTGNTSTNDDGGALYVDQATGTVNITNTTFSDNSAHNDGGAIYDYYSTIDISGSTFSGNTAKNGASTYNDGGTINFGNSTFYGNGAGSGFSGGVIYQDGARLTISNSTFANAQQTVSLAVNSGSASLLDSVLAANGQANCFGPISDLGGNLADDSSCNFTQSSSHSSINPQLGPLQDNGGPTQTMALQPGSPAIGAAVNCPATDQRGEPRPASGCDSGAYQTAPGTPGALAPPGAAGPPPRAMTLRVRVWRQIPPLVSDGQIEGTVAPVAGATVEALIGETVCGQGTTDRQGQVQLMVATDPPTPGCGRPGLALTFRVNGHLAASDPLRFQSGGQAAVTLRLPGPMPPQGR